MTRRIYHTSETTVPEQLPSITDVAEHLEFVGDLPLSPKLDDYETITMLKIEGKKHVCWQTSLTSIDQVWQGSQVNSKLKLNWRGRHHTLPMGLSKF